MCRLQQMFTQCVDDAHGQLNAQEHEGPACSSESPCLHTVVLMFLRKNLLQETKKLHQLPEPIKVLIEQK